MPFSGRAWDAGFSMRNGAQIILEEVNKNPNILPGFELKVVWQDSHCRSPRGTQQFLENIFERKYTVVAPGLNSSQWDVDGDHDITSADLSKIEGIWGTAEVSPDPVALFGSGCSSVALDIANIAHVAKFPLVSPSASRPSLSDRALFPSFFRTVMPDTAFCNPWIALAKFFGHTSLVGVIAEATDWHSIGTKIGQAALTQGVELAGHDLTHEIPGFYGLQITLDSMSSAQGVATELMRLKRRFVILTMYEPRARVIVCASYRQGFMSAVFMPLSWFAAGWWKVQDTPCTPAQNEQALTGFISVKILAFRTDVDTRLGCSDSMTVAQFRRELNRREENATAEGYTRYEEPAFAADGLCTLALMLHKVLVVEGVPLAEMVARSQRSFDLSQKYLTETDFEGVQARIQFDGADPKSAVVIEQMQPAGFVQFAIYNHPSFRFLGKNISFGFPGEHFFAGPAGASTFPARLNHYVTCPSGKLAELTTNTCKDCPENMEFVQAAGRCLCVAGFVANESGCSPCRAGLFSDVSGTLECSECPVGKYSDPAATDCTYCPRGFYAERAGTSSCAKCPSLQTTREIGSVGTAQCICDSGAYRAQNGTACRACPTNASTLGIASTDFSACRCAKGMYMSAGLSRCVACPRDSSTEEEGRTSLKSCLCRDGTYMPLGAAACAPCPGGMECPKGSNEANFVHLGQTNLGLEQRFPRLQTRFWASAEAPMQVFDCRDENRCPGGAPGRACVANLGSMCCQHCVSGYHWDGKQCDACKGLKNFGYFMLTAVLLLGPIIVAILYKMSGDEFHKWGSRNNTLNVLGFITLNHYQVIDLIVSGGIILPQSFRSGFDNIKWTNDPYRIIQPGCIGFADLTVSMSVKASAPVVVGLICLATACLSVLASRVLRRPELKMTRDRLFNIFGSVMFTFFGAIANMSMSLLKCTSNPSGSYTLSMDLSVICFDSAQWRSMLGISIVCVVIYIVGLGAVLLRTIIVAPAYFQNRGFQVRWKFLFIKFHSGAYWWGIVYLARNTILQLIFVLTSTGMLQVYLSIAALMIYVAIAAAVLPYRAIVSNVVDMMESTVVIYIAGLLVSFAPGRAEHENELATTTGAFIALPFAITSCGVVYLFAYGRRAVPSDAVRQKAEQDFREIRESARALADMPSETGSEMLLWLGDWERFYLTKSSYILRTDLLGNCSKSRIANHEVPGRITTSIMQCRSKSFRSTLLHKHSVELDDADVGAADLGNNGEPERTPAPAPEKEPEDGPYEKLFKDFHDDSKATPGLGDDSGGAHAQAIVGKHIPSRAAPDGERPTTSDEDLKFAPPKIVAVEPGPDEACVDELGSFLSLH